MIKGINITHLTSDWHFFHKNAVEVEDFLPGRLQFKDVNEMNDTIVSNINSVVSNETSVLAHLGDISFGKPKETLEILNRIHVKHIVLIKGNHDNNKMLKYIAKKSPMVEYGNQQIPKYIIVEVGIIQKYGGKSYYLTHYPLGLGKREKLRSFCGHIHEKDPRDSNVLNVGIDSPSVSHLPFGTPLSFEEAVKIIENKYMNVGSFK